MVSFTDSGHRPSYDCQYEVQNKKRYMELRKTTRIEHAGDIIKIDHILVCMNCLKYMIAENKIMGRLLDAYVDELDEKEVQLEDRERTLQVGNYNLKVNTTCTGYL